MERGEERPSPVIYQHIDWQAVRGVAFDMDGTLYRADAEVMYQKYADHLIARAMGADGVQLGLEIERWFAGSSYFNFDYTYDPERRWLVRTLPNGRFDGYSPCERRYLAPEYLAEVYSMGLAGVELIGLGDGWMQLSSAAHCHGATLEDIKAAYLALQADMIAHPARFGLTEDRLLGDTLRHLAAGGYALAVVTMSDDVAAEGVLRALGVYEAFHRVMAGVQKPAETLAALEKASADCAIPLGSWLMVGDNPVNDLAPVKVAGIPTILVHRRSSRGAADGDIHVETLAECLQLLRGHLIGDSPQDLGTA